MPIFTNNDLKRNRKINSFLVVILGYILINAGCQSNSGVGVTKEVVFLPTSTPVTCPDSSAVSLVITPTVLSKAVNEIQVTLTGLEPGESVALLFESKSLTETSVIESHPISVSDASGNFMYKEQGFSKLAGNEKNQWSVKAIHKRGVNCTSVTLPR